MMFRHRAYRTGSAKDSWSRVAAPSSTAAPPGAGAGVRAEVYMPAGRAKTLMREFAAFRQPRSASPAVSLTPWAFGPSPDLAVWNGGRCCARSSLHSPPLAPMSRSDPRAPHHCLRRLSTRRLCFIHDSQCQRSITAANFKCVPPLELHGCVCSSGRAHVGGCTSEWVLNSTDSACGALAGL